MGDLGPAAKRLEIHSVNIRAGVRFHGILLCRVIITPLGYLWCVCRECVMETPSLDGSVDHVDILSPFLRDFDHSELVQTVSSVLAAKLNQIRRRYL